MWSVTFLTGLMVALVLSVRYLLIQLYEVEKGLSEPGEWIPDHWHFAGRMKRIKHYLTAQEGKGASGGTLKYTEKEYWRDLLLEVPVLVCRVDEKGYFTWVNNTTCRWLGLDRMKVTQTRYWPRFQRTPIDEPVEYDTPDQLAVTVVDAPGEPKMIVWQIKPLPGSQKQGGGYLMAGWEVTDWELSHRSMRYGKEMAEASNRAKSLFLAHMGHEIRTPMHVVMGMADLLLDEKPSSRQVHYLGVMQRNIQSLLELIEHTLELSRIEAGELKVESAPFSLDRLLSVLVHSFQEEHKNGGQQLEVKVEEGVARWLIGDAIRLRQALEYLLGLTVRVGGGKEIQLVVAPDPDKKGSIRFSVWHAVEDQTGFSLGEWFESFVNTDDAMPRLEGGLGLSWVISKRLVTLMGGGFWVETQFGKGSGLHLTMPLAVAGSSERAEGVQSDKETEDLTPDISFELAGLDILLVEDFQDNIMMVQAFLNKTKHRLQIARNGVEAVEQYVDKRFDLVLMDIQMPVMDGYTATRQIRGWERDQERKQTPILALTAFGMTGDERISLEAGCDAHLSKPITKTELLAAIERYGYSGNDAGRELVSDSVEKKNTKDDQEIVEVGDEAINWSVFKQMSMEMPAKFESLADEFCRTLPNRLTTMVQARENGKVADFCNEAHRLKGAAGFIGAETLAEWSRLVEIQMKEQGRVAEDKFLILVQEAEKVQRALGRKGIGV
ncbi:MAG: response regulator [Magnetococcales bacterium]|nr:response regulator [Magnetococcales bacterium]